MGGGSVLPRPPRPVHITELGPDGVLQNPTPSPNPCEAGETTSQMDPLSLVASIIAVLQVSGKTIQGLRGISTFIRNAPDDLLSLNNEVSDLHAILSVIDAQINPQGGSAPGPGFLDTSRSSALLALTVAIVQAKLRDLDELIAGFSCITSKTEFYTRWLRQREKAKRIQEGLRRARENLQTSISLATLEQNNRIELHIAGQQQQFLAAKTMEMLSSAVAGHLQGLHSAPSGEIRPTKPAKNRVIAIHTSPLRCRPSCHQWCSCACHQRGSTKLPSALELILGCLFINYTGIPILTPACTEKSCQRRAALSLDIVYFFPLWILARSLMMNVSISPVAGLKLTLKTPRLVRWIHREAQLFHLARDGDIAGMQSMLGAGIVSTQDMTVAQGETALFHAVSCAQFKACKFLLEQGANAYAANRWEVKPVDVAWKWILSGKLGSEEADFARSLFHDDEYLESRQFTVIHKIVLGLVDMDLDQQLTASTATIDCVDSSEQTALAWAASRGDLESVQVLLDHGANTEVHDMARGFPLHYAAQAHSAECVGALLKAGADFEARNAHLQTPLHIASREADGNDCVKALLGAGADVNAGHMENETALMHAARAGNINIAETLLEHGADLNTRTIWGLTALDLSVLYGTVAMFEFLLQAGADVLTKDGAGQTVLHRIAEHGNPAMARALVAKEPKDIRLDDADNNGVTARHLLEARGDQELTEALSLPE